MIILHILISGYLWSDKIRNCLVLILSPFPSLRRDSLIYTQFVPASPKKFILFQLQRPSRFPLILRRSFSFTCDMRSPICSNVWYFEISRVDWHDMRYSEQIWHEKSRSLRVVTSLQPFTRLITMCFLVSNAI